MLLFGKKRYTEEELADGLVHIVSKRVYDNWDEIRHLIRECLTPLVDEKALPELPEACAPFMIIATVFTDMQAESQGGFERRDGGTGRPC